MFSDEEIAEEYEQRTSVRFDLHQIKRDRYFSTFKFLRQPKQWNVPKQKLPTWKYLWWPIKRARAVMSVLEALKQTEWE